ncbi:hypothetical protein [Marinilactibacillus psychrotolerans]|uniref:hypothetical protein n=1 Tax=Marinilactibacillus psychrotolerans TaxID=191770 RepID=UPI00388A6249
MIINVDYEVGTGGNVSVEKDEETFDFEITEFDENDYADIGVEVQGHGESWILNDVYNRNALPGHEDVRTDEYNKIFNDIKLEVIDSIKGQIESHFENV